MKKKLRIFAVALLIAVLDQLTKFLIRKNIELGESIPIIKNFLNITYITNTGSAFGAFKGFNLLFMAFSVIVVGIILYNIKSVKENEKAMQAAFGLILAGAIGNFIDRLLYGAVTDFIDIPFFSVFNVADSAITISVAILIIILWNRK